MRFDDLSTLLWREHDLLDLLLFKAEEKQYMIVTGKTRWLPRIAQEIEVILGELRTLEVQRAAETEAIAEFLGLEESPSLRAVAEAAGDPWKGMLLKHHENLLKIITEIRGLSEINRGLIDSGLSAINDVLRTAQPTAGTYTATGRQTAEPHRAVTLDGAL